MKREVLLLLVFSCSMFGCLHSRQDVKYQGPQERPDSLLAKYNYARASIVYTEDPASTKFEADYCIRKITFDSGFNLPGIGDHKIEIDYYELTAAGKSPLVLVLPILNGENILASNTASYLAQNGFSAMIVHRQEKYKSEDNIDKVNMVLEQMVYDHMQAIDWAETRMEIDIDNIGVVGFSMGGIKAALLSGIDYRIKSTAIIVAGSGVADILTFTNLKRLANIRHLVMKEKGITRTDFKQSLEDKLICDPENYAQYIDSNNTMMVIAVLDLVIPPSRQKALRRKIGNPETFYLLAGHHTTFLCSPILRRKIRDFFEEKLTTE